ncbi:MULTISPECIES: hypothetical protein [Brevibacillus]|uniref:hypothetical protein n=1 Tax=Brevibacillus TaxID=55080 RepID=UPI00287FE3F5|nr:hypothetical protein [Brevibacillus borstelensis]WNF05508.1 hypothetical protein RFB14_24795 [Brevibacillus borstelensis]
MTTMTNNKQFEKRLEVQRKKQISREIQAEIDKGVSGKELSRKVYHIINKKRQVASQRKKSIYIKPRPKEKKKIRTYLIETGKINRFAKRQLRTQLYLLVQTFDKLKELALTTNMFELIFPNLRQYQEGQKLPCELRENSIAWIAKDPQKGVYRYFSEKDGKIIGINIFDLLEIVDGVEDNPREGFRKAILELARLLDLDQLKDSWVLDQESKYERNLKVLQTAQAKMKRKYPTLGGFMVDEHLRVLEFMHHYGKSHVNRLMNHQGEAIFYIATTHIAEAIDDGKLDQPAVSRTINLLTAIGLIEKIPYEELSKEQLDIAIGIRGANGKRQLVTYYRMPDYTDPSTFQAAEDMARKLSEVGIRKARDMTEEKLRSHFGNELAKSVYLPHYRLAPDEEIPF